jgi:hypothetical protein
VSKSPVPPASPSYEELAALVAAQGVQLAEQARQLAEQARLIEVMRVELAALRRQAGRDSTNSSQPPSQDGPAAKARAAKGSGDSADAPQASDADRPTSHKRGTATRKQGGQPGHRGRGLARVANPDRTEPVEPAPGQ